MTPTRRRWSLNYYITQCTGNSISWRQDAVEKASTQQREPSGPRLISWGSDELGIRCSRESQHPERLGPQVPGWAAQENGKETLMAIRVGVNMLQFCSVSNSLSHTTLSIKWEVYFSKNCVARLHCAYVDVYVLCVCIVGHGYTTLEAEIIAQGSLPEVMKADLKSKCQSHKNYGWNFGKETLIYFHGFPEWRRKR